MIHITHQLKYEMMQTKSLPAETSLVHLIICYICYFRPAVAMTVILMLIQKLSAKFFFLQERGNVLAMNNR